MEMSKTVTLPLAEYKALVTDRETLMALDKSKVIKVTYQYDKHYGEYRDSIHIFCDDEIIKLRESCEKQLESLRNEIATLKIKKRWWK